MSKEIDFKQVNPIIYPDIYYTNLLRPYKADKALNDKENRYQDINQPPRKNINNDKQN